MHILPILYLVTLSSNMDIVTVLRCIDISLSVLGMFLHAMGLYILTKARRKTSQVFILMNLSATYLIFFVVKVGATGDRLGVEKYDSVDFDDTRNITQVAVFMVFGSITGIELTFTMLFLTADRFINCVLPLKYSIQADEKKLFKKLIIASWIFTVSFSLLGVKQSLFSVVR